MNGKAWINIAILVYNHTLDYISGNFLDKGALFMDLWEYELQAAIFVCRDMSSFSNLIYAYLLRSVICQRRLHKAPRAFQRARDY